MRILLITAGSRGDVEPFISLGERARDAGHTVRVALPDNSGVDTGSLDIVSLGVDYTAMIREQGVSLSAALRAYRTVVRPVMRGVIVGGARAALGFQPDVLVSHPKVLSAPMVADALGVPHVLVEMVPALTATREFPAAGTLTRGFGAVNRLTYALTHQAAAAFRGDLNEVRRMTGARRNRASEPAATLMPISPAILPAPADWPASVHLTGPWRTRQHAATVPPQVDDFMAGGAFAYAGFGSMATGDPVARGRAIVDAARSRGLRVLVATGLGGIIVPPDRRGDDVLVVEAVPHDRVLPRAQVAVHHGGIGTIQSAMAAGSPSVIVPFIADQPFWGERLLQAGLAPAPIRQRSLTAGRLRSAIGEADGFRTRVSEVGTRMADEDGTGAALTVLASLA